MGIPLFCAISRVLPVEKRKMANMIYAVLSVPESRLPLLAEKLCKITDRLRNTRRVLSMPTTRLDEKNQQTFLKMGDFFLLNDFYTKFNAHSIIPL